MNEAKLRGIDLKELRKESPTDPSQLAIRAWYEHRARTYWQRVAEPYRPDTAPRIPKYRGQVTEEEEPNNYTFTDRQMAIALQALEVEDSESLRDI